MWLMCGQTYKGGIEDGDLQLYRDCIPSALRCQHFRFTRARNLIWWLVWNAYLNPITWGRLDTMKYLGSTAKAIGAFREPLRRTGGESCLYTVRSLAIIKM